MLGVGSPRTFAQLSDYWTKPDASCALYTDAKIDDALFLWTFCLSNLWRPSKHRVAITINVMGICDRGAGVSLVKHLWACARRYAASVAPNRPLATVHVDVLASRNVPRQAPRHEIDLYTFPPGWPPVEKESALTYFQDDDASPKPADLVIVISQYFLLEVGPSLAELDRLTPCRGGVLAFQAGFNTATRDASQGRAIWSTLAARARARSAPIICISNAYSFSAAPPSREMDLAHPFFSSLRQQDASLWDHLLTAGTKESFRFAVDQMAKFLAGQCGECGGRLHAIRADAGYDEAAATSSGAATSPREAPAEVSTALAASFLEWRAAKPAAARQPEERNPVVLLCERMRDAAAEAEPGETANQRLPAYLRRAVSSLDGYGTAIEITDGQHLACVMQSEEAVLWPSSEPPAEPSGGEAEDATTTSATASSAVSDDTASSGSVLWTAQGISRERSYEWMMQLLNEEGARKCLGMAVDGGDEAE